MFDGLHVIGLAINTTCNVQIYRDNLLDNSHGIIYIPCVLYDCCIWRISNLN